MQLLRAITKGRTCLLSAHSFLFSATKTSSLFNPYTLELISEKPYLTEDQLFTKITQTTSAFKKWRTVELEDRIKYVHKFVRSVIDDKEALKPQMAGQLGKSYRNIDEEFGRVEKIAFDLIESGRKALKPEIIEQNENILKKTIYEPVGLSLIFPYYSEPIFDSLINLIPCLISGNGALIKPSDFNHFLGTYLENKSRQILHMDGLISELFISPKQLPYLPQFRSLKKVLYSGSSQSAKHIFETLIKSRFIDCNLFFGGKDAAFVGDSADLELAAKEIVKNAFYNNGQSYDSLNRVYIEEDIEEIFLDLLRKEIQLLKYGDPKDQNNNIGPLCVAENAIIAESLVRIVQLKINDSISSGAKCQIGGLKANDGQSQAVFFEPTLLSSCTNDMPIVQTQLHAPILCAITASMQTAAQQINESEYGTGVRIFTKQIEKYRKVVQQLQVGKICFNTGSLFNDNLPIEGWKKSGKGKLLSELSYQEFSIPKSYNFKKNI